MANTNRNTLMTDCVAAVAAPNSSRIAGSAGISINDEMGPSALAPASRAMRLRGAVAGSAAVMAASSASAPVSVTA